MSTDAAGRNRKSSAYAKNGTVATHAKERRLRPDRTSGRIASGATPTAMAQAPTFAGQSVAIFALAADCWPRLANFAFAYSAGDGRADSSELGIFLRFARSLNRAGCAKPLRYRSCPWSE